MPLECLHDTHLISPCSREHFWLLKIAAAEIQIAILRQQQIEVETTLQLLREDLAQCDDEHPRQATTPSAVVVSTATDLYRFRPDKGFGVLNMHFDKLHNLLFQV